MSISCTISTVPLYPAKPRPGLCIGHQGRPRIPSHFLHLTFHELHDLRINTLETFLIVVQKSAKIVKI